MADTSKTTWTTPQVDLLRTASSAESGSGVSNSETAKNLNASYVPSGPR